MYADNITIGTRTYALVSRTSEYSIYKDAAAVSPNEYELKIAHTHTKSGKVNSMVLLNDKVVVPGAFDQNGNAKFENVTVHVKASYGANASINTDTVVTSLVADVVDFVSESSNITKFLNEEH